MNDFTRDITLIFKPDERSLNSVEDELKSLQKSIDLSGKEQEQIKNMKAAQQELKKLQQTLSDYEGINNETAKKITEELKRKISENEEYLGIGEDPNAEGKAQVAAFAKQKLMELGQWFLGKLASTFTDAWAELKNMLSYSRLSNANTRNLAFTYGFSSSQAYGYQSAMDALGFKNVEDLFYANQQEIELFKNAFNKYSEKYQELADKGVFEKMLEFQVEMNEFRQDLKLEVVDFFMNNKDTIKLALKGIIKITEAVMKIASFFLETDRVSSRSAAVSDVVSSYSNNKTTNVSIDNTFNGIDTSQRQNLTRLGTLTTQQLIAALK